jgi:uncharacterized phage protein (TIGR01671 family)
METKFRAWDNENQEWVKDPVYVGANGIVFDCEEKELVAPADLDRFEVTQYTGLKDMRGKEIFVGDILQWSDIDTQRVTVNDAHGYRFMFGKDQLTKMISLNGEVVGNIYEMSANGKTEKAC